MSHSSSAPAGTWQEVFSVFLKLGVTSFGGPIAHLGYFRDAIVVKRGWLSESAYADLVALCQFLPGPASSQVGMGIGLSRAGYAGAAAAWVAFTLPSALLLLLFGLGVAAAPPEGMLANALHGLKVAAVAVVAHAVWGMGKSLTPDATRATMAVLATAFVLLVDGPMGQVGAIVLGGFAGLMFCGDVTGKPSGDLGIRVRRRTGFVFVVLFALLLVGLPLLVTVTGSQAVALFDSFYRAGSLVFGGGHVVLPLLEAEVTDPGWVSQADFLAGYGAAQAVPGPLFTFAAFLGAVSELSPNGAIGAMIALIAIFMPSFLLVAGALPFWQRLTAYAPLRAALAGVNAAVVGLLLAALYDPVWTSAVGDELDFLLALFCFLSLQMWKAPAWAVVASAAILGAIIPIWA